MTLGHGSHVLPVSERGRRAVVEVGTGSKTEHHDLAGHHRDQPQGKGSERRETGLRVSRRERAVRLSRVHAELVLDPVPHGVHTEHVRVSHVFFRTGQ